MAYQLRLRRGNAAQHAVFVGALGEITYNTSNNTIHGHDGNTTGGFEVALKSDLSDLVLGNITVLSTVDLSSNTTDDLPEGVANLYFTNARVRSSLSVGTGLDYDEANGIFTANVDLSDYALINSLANVAFTGEYSDLANSLADTDDLPEGSSNLYFTNSRAVQAFTAGDNINIEANGLIVSSAAGGTVTSVGITAGALIDVVGSPVTTSGNITVSVDLSELETTTNTSLADHMVVVDAETANQYKILKTNIPLSHFNVNLTTSNIAEGSNLYFSNTRAIGAFTAGENIAIEANGLISTGSGIDDLTAVATDIRPVTDKTLDIGNTTNRWNVLYANAIAIGNIVLKEGGFSLYYTTNLGSTVNLFNTDRVPEGDNLYFSNDRAIAAVTGQAISLFNNDAGYITAANISSLTTSNIAEGSNLYFTNARAVGSLTAGDGIVIESNGLVSSTITGVVESVNGQIGNVVLTTANIAEDSNLYFTNARAVGALTAGSGVVIEANGLIISPTESIYNGTTSVNIPSANGAIVFDVDGVSDVANISSWGLNVNSNLNVTGDIFGNLYSLDNHTTSNLAEGSNLYFTNARALAAVVDNIDTSNVTEGSNLYYTDARVLDVLASIDGNVVPNGNTYDLGDSTNTWNNVYASNIVLDGSITTTATGIPTVESNTTLRLTANDAVVVTSSPFQLASFSLAEIQNIVAANGMMVYNTTNAKIQAYANGSWVDLH